MISFLNSSLLWLLPLAAGPIVLHLFFLRKARKIPFTDLELLKTAYLRSLPSSRLRQWLLLAARCLILGSLILAFARPVLESSAPASAAARDSGLRLALLVDRSYSMRYRVNGKTRFSAAVAAGRSILKSMGGQDRAIVVPFSDRPELPDSGAAWLDDAQASEALGRLEPGFGVTDYAPALQSAFEALAKAPGRRAIVVLSDNAAHGLKDPSRWRERVAAFDPAVPLLGLTWSDAPDNAAVLSVEPQSSRPDGTEGLDAKLGLIGASRGDWDLSLWNGPRREEEKRLSLLQGTTAAASFSLRSQGPAAWGRLQLREDALPEDDAFYFSLWKQTRPKVLLAFGGSRSMQVGRGAYFLGKLFVDPRGSLLPYQVEIVDAVRLSSIRLEDYQAVLLVDFKSVPSALAQSLVHFVRAGGGLWLVPGRWDNPHAFQALSSVMPARWLELLDFEGGGGVRPEPTGEPGFSWREFDPASVSVRRAYVLAPEPGARVWLRDAGRRPLLVSGSFGAGRVFLLASSLDVDWTNLALKPVFAPWVDWTLGRLTGYSSRREWRTVALGRKFTRVWRPEEAAPSSVRVVGPNHRIVSVRVEGRRLEFEPTEPGLYYVESASGSDVFAANLDRSSGESDPRPMSSPPWQSVRPEAAREDFQRLLFGREARNDCLGLALLLLLAETLLSSRPTSHAAAFALLMFAAMPVGAQEGDRFAWTQLRYDGDWDPYPTSYHEALGSLVRMTSVLVTPERRVIRLTDPTLFASPFLMITGRQAPPNLSDQEIRRLRDFLVSGGFVWIEDASGLRASSFDAWTRRTFKAVFPDSDLVPLGGDHVLFKTFFLMRGIGGRNMVESSLEGIDWSGRTAVVYSRNDILGALVKDALGRPLYECVPGGEAQRDRAQKLALNIVMYALTGNYKADAVHQPFLLQKMRMMGTSP